MICELLFLFYVFFRRHENAPEKKKSFVDCLLPESCVKPDFSRGRLGEWLGDDPNYVIEVSRANFERFVNGLNELDDWADVLLWEKWSHKAMKIDKQMQVWRVLIENF